MDESCNRMRVNSYYLDEKRERKWREGILTQLSQFRPLVTLGISTPVCFFRCEFYLFPMYGLMRIHKPKFSDFKGRF